MAMEERKNADESESKQDAIPGTEARNLNDEELKEIVGGLSNMTSAAGDGTVCISS